MLNHVSIGVSDIARSQVFYDKVLEPLGYKRLSTDDTSLGYGNHSIGLWLLATKNPVRPDMSSGLHFCFESPTRRGVEDFHKAATAFGGSDNGGPGVREDYADNYFAAFVVDPDGYRIEAYCASQ